SERPRISKELLLKASRMESFLFGWIRLLIFREAILIGIEAYFRVRERFGVGWIKGWFKESSQVCRDSIFVG
ncbi:46413_t:CDS:1, partial [Gigaspora margarita]